MRFLPIALIFFTATAADLPDSVIRLAQLKRQMADVLNHMPDYTCSVTVDRASRPSAKANIIRSDTLRYEVAHTGGKELFSWVGAQRFEDQSVVGSVRFGLVSDGEFVGHARTIFLDGYSNIRFIGSDDVDGRNALRWDYQLPLFGSGWKVTYNNRSAQVASHGSFWVDPSSLDLLRLDIHADDIPPDFPYSEVLDSIRYSRVRIGTANVLLPQTAIIVLDESAGKLSRNIVEFSHCRQYLGEAVLSFDEPETETALPPSALPPAAPTELALPRGLTLKLQLSAAINSTTAVIGDFLEAAIAADVTLKGKILIPAGTTVHGRLRRIEKRNGPPVQYGIGLEFTEMEISGKRVRCFGKMTKLETPVNGFVAIGYKGLFQSDRGTSTTLAYVPAIPGVATFLVKGNTFYLPKGMTMVWTTGEAKSKAVLREYPDRFADTGLDLVHVFPRDRW